MYVLVNLHFIGSAQNKSYAAIPARTRIFSLSISTGYTVLQLCSVRKLLILDTRIARKSRDHTCHLLAYILDLHCERTYIIDIGLVSTEGLKQIRM